MKALGWLLTIIGSLLVFYGALIGNKVYGVYGISHNVIHMPSILIGGLMLVIGVMLLLANFLSKNQAHKANNKFIGYADTKNDAYKIYLTKKYDIAFNSTLNKFICENKLFDNVEEALKYGKDLDWQENKVFYEIASKAANTNERIIDISEVKGDGVFLILKIVIALAIVGILLIKFSP
jgi:hypothetical protein